MIKNRGPRTRAAIGVATAIMAAALGTATSNPALAEAGPGNATEAGPGNGPGNATEAGTSSAADRFATRPFSFLSKASSGFVSAENGGATPLVANRSLIGEWELFKIFDNADGTTSLQSRVSQKFVTAGDGGDSPLIASRDAIGLSEKFDLATVPDDPGAFSLKSKANNKFVAYTSGTGALVASNTDNSSNTTRFYKAALPVTSVLTARSTGENVTVSPTTSQLTATGGTHTTLAEQFALFDAGDGRYALRAASTKFFVSAENAGASPLVANRTTIGAWELFDLVTNNDDTISLRAIVNNQYVATVSPNYTGPLTANSNVNAPFGSSPQRFTLTGVPQPQIAALRSNVNGGFVTRIPPDARMLASGTSIIGPVGLKFTFSGTATVTLSDPDGTPVAGQAIPGGGLRLLHGGVGIGLTFRLVNHLDGTVSLLCLNNGLYVGLTSLGTGGAELVARSPTAGPTERFTFIRLT